jgi:addiction module HigA family antidote
VTRISRPRGIAAPVGRAAGVAAQRIGEILAGKRAFTADAGPRLCRFLGLSDDRWLRPQAAYDIEIAKVTFVQTLARIEPCKEEGRAHDGYALSRNEHAA